MDGPMDRGTMSRVEIRTIRKAQSGDGEALRAILEAYQRPVMATLYRLLGSRHAAEIEDYAQDLFLRIFRALGRFDFGRRTKFSTWIYTFVKNYCLDVLKKRRLEMVSMTTREAEERPTEFVHPGIRPGDPMDRSELQQFLGAAIDALPEDQRVVFVLREYEDLGYGEIAEVLSVSEGTVKSRLYRAKDALRVKLAPYLRDGSKLPATEDGVADWPEHDGGRRSDVSFFETEFGPAIEGGLT